MRPGLCEDALRLGRVLAGLAPHEPEVHGLCALMEIQASRSAARTGPTGEPILLLEQNRARWDRLLIRRGLAALDRAGAARRRAAARMRCRPRSPRATRARARPPTPTGARIAALYDALGAARALAGRRAQPRGRGRDGVRPGGGARASSTRSCRTSRARGLPPAAERARRPAREARPLRRSARGVRARRRRSRATRASRPCSPSAPPHAFRPGPEL